jgi:ATP-binding cassette subfamily C (CFTR/MRP) protein 1
VERITEYSLLKAEAAPIVEANRPPPTWPSKGDIQFTNVHFSYFKGGPEILKNVSFHISGKEKIGIVGRFVVFTAYIKFHIESILTKS